MRKVERAPFDGPVVDYEKLKADSRAPVEAEAKEFTSSLGLDTPEQMRKWCIEKMKSSKLMRRIKV
jgi:hypothetical protein